MATRVNVDCANSAHETALRDGRLHWHLKAWSAPPRAGRGPGSIGSETPKENSMANSENRVLGRVGARELTSVEVEVVAGAAAHTLVCTAALATATVTGPGDGDGCSDTDGDH